MEIEMKIRSFIVAVAVLSFATAASADYMTLGKKYSSSQLASICERSDGSWYRAARGTYGCVAGGNVVECSNAGVCTGYTRTPFALVTTGASNQRAIGAGGGAADARGTGDPGADQRRHRRRPGRAAVETTRPAGESGLAALPLHDRCMTRVTAPRRRASPTPGAGS
jgi:hypothetical protein